MSNVAHNMRPSGASRDGTEAGGGGLDDRVLVRQAQAGSETAFEELIRRHQQRVFAVVRRLLRKNEDVEDVAQQVFIKAYRALGRFDLRSAFSTWLYKIAVNQCWDYLRKRKARPLSYEADLSEEQAEQLKSHVEDGKSAETLDERLILSEMVENLLGGLSEEDRQMLLMKEVEGFSIEEIAQVFGLNLNTVKVRLFRARGKLAAEYRRQARATSGRAAGG